MCSFRSIRCKGAGFKQSLKWRKISENISAYENGTDRLWYSEICPEIGIEQFVVEQDICDGDVFETIKTSYDNLKNMLEK
jgi:hypothetical protein